MTHVLFIHGAHAGSHATGAVLAAGLERQLGAAYKVRYPRMPNEAAPAYADWASTLTQELRSIDGPFVLVGHSLGASFLLRYLASNDDTPAPLGVFLAAPPYFGDGGWTDDDFALPADAAQRLARTPLSFFHGEADDIVPPSHASLHESTFPQAKVMRLAGRDHQLGEDVSELAAAIRLAPTTL